MTINSVQTFHLETSNLRGRILRLDTVLTDILNRHNYPHPVDSMTGEAVVMALLLSSMLKYDGIFTLQIQGEGPVSMVVADVTCKGVVRACANYKKDHVFHPGDTISNLMKGGYMAFTVDQGENTERYQGIVQLMGDTLLDSVQHYFAQSEQITTGIRLSLDRSMVGGWRAGAIMLQQLPEQKQAHLGETREDDWRRAMILLQSCTDEELTDHQVPPQDLLFRLFHEEGIRVFDPISVLEDCRCSQQRAEEIIGIMTAEDKADMTVDGKITVTCEFCNRVYELDQAEGA